MTDKSVLLRAELALAALGLTATLLVLLFAIDAIHHHGSDVGAQSALTVVSLLVIARAVASLVRQLGAQRTFLRRLPVSRVVSIGGLQVQVIPGQTLRAFCAGLVRPAVYVSEGTLRTDPAELRAILAHEEHHRSRRDPLRQLLARIVSDALGPLPPFAAMAEREAALADLAADAAAVHALGDRAPLASAMVRFDEIVGIAPERVDRLLGRGGAVTIPVVVLAAAGLALIGIVTAIAAMLFSAWHPDVTLPVALEAAALLAASTPACLAASRAGVCVAATGG